MDGDKTEDPIEAATPEENDEGIKVPSRSTADESIDAEGRAEKMKLDNMTTATADSEDVTPGKLKEHYLREMKGGRVNRSRTGLETRIRRDYEAAGKTISDEKASELAADILGQ